MVEKLIALDTASPKQILVIGDALIDVWMLGRVSTCQDNCNKFVEQDRVISLGGAANAANCLKHWNSRCALLTQRDGEQSVKTRFVQDGRILFRYDIEMRASAPACVTALVSKADAILISDYDKGFLTRDFIAAVVALGVPVVADAKRKPDFYEGCILKCNDAYSTIYNEVHFRPNTVITYGRISPTVVGVEEDSPHIANAECVNHVGAGDCFAAHLTLALAHGFSLEDAAAIAHSAGRAYVQHPYNRPPRPSEIALTLMEELV